MTTFRATLKLHTAFGTPLAGDTLFGQMCWTAREHLGESELERLLEGYTSGKPWLVVSDGFPSGYLPKPTAPASLLVGAAPVGANLFAQSNQAQQRKAEKAKRWIPLSEIGKPLAQMLAVSDKEAYGEYCKPVEAPQPHNTLSRLTGTTGEGDFAPYTRPQIFFARDQRMDVYFVLDEDRMSLERFQTLLEAIGSHGFGRDASIGLGKFTVENLCANFVGADSSAQNIENRSNKFDPTAYLTLAPCAPQGQGFDGNKSYWRIITRFGRHGNLHGVSSKPFKNPVLFAATGALFVPQDKYTPRQFIGQGLGGNGQLSKIEPATVQQGYAPVVGIRMEA
jgi:CRISPR-associated protein Csm4